MILVLCANAGVDRTYEVDGFEAGQYHRPERMRVGAGGKGINVARVVRALGPPVRVAGFAGGMAGAFVAADLRRAGLETAFTRIGEESRTTLTVVDPRGKQVTRLDEWGPLVSPAEAQALTARWGELLGEAELAAISGNPPRGLARDFYTALVAEARRQGVPLVLDAHEEPLQAGIAGLPAALKVNQKELGWLAERPLAVPEGVVEYSRQLLELGVGAVLTTAGAAGAILVSADGKAVHLLPPPVECTSAVGSGDAALGGYLVARQEGLSAVDQARWAVAAGTANCTKLGAGVCRRDEVEALAAEVTLRELS